MACGDLAVKVLSNLRPFSVGEALPIGIDGFVFPDATVLRPRKIAGVMSDGKILSEADVEYSDNQEVILPLPVNAETGALIPDLLGITDMILKFKLTANRSDCLSVYGIARELSAILDKPLKKTPFDAPLDTVPRDVEFSVAIKDKKLCPRYTGRVLRDIRIEQSPVWLKRRLIAAGMRPINGIVDVTNYVMLEAGQPLHAFDLDTLKDRAIIVRRARAGERIITIDGTDQALTTDMLVIADSKVPVAVAGVMGGALTEVKTETKNLLLESAHFAPRSIRRTSIALGLRSEASLRFEKGVDTTRVLDSGNYAAYLMQKLGWASALDAPIDAYPLPYKARTINVPFQKIRDFLGDPAVDNARMVSILNRLDFKIQASKTSLKAAVPGHRFDVSIWEDLAEEVARIYGYQHVRSELPATLMHRARVTPHFAFIRKLKDMLAACGLSESVTFSFTTLQELKDIWMDDNLTAVPLLNPLTEEHTHLRPTLIPAMLRVIARNLSRGNQDMALFELGKIFPGPGAPQERDSLVMAVCGNVWQTPTLSSARFDMEPYYLMKGIIEDFLGRVCDKPLAFRKSTLSLFHPAHSASVFWGNDKIGEFGELHPQVCANFDIRSGVILAELNPEVICEHLSESITYQKFSRYPASYRDLSFHVTEEVEAESIREIIVHGGGDVLHRASTINVYRSEDVGVDKKSVTFSLEFRHLDRTLNDEEINAAIAHIIDVVREKAGGVLRAGD
jgi:phenylalanyl-tRNA synthetase beta chain